MGRIITKLLLGLSLLICAPEVHGQEDMFHSLNWTQPAGGGGYDTDAQNFFDAVATAGITLNSTIKGCIDAYVVGMKADGNWTGTYVDLPLVGGTAAAHAINLKSPGTYNTTWSGTITHNSNGVTGDGSSGYGNTNFNPTSAGASQNSISLSWYNRTSGTPTANRVPMGADLNTGLEAFYTSGTQLQVYINDVTGRTVTVTNHQGFFSMTRTSSTAIAVYRNGTSVGSIASTSSNNNLNGDIYILALNSFGPLLYSDRNYCHFRIDIGRNATQQGQINTRVEALHDCLGRGVQ